MNEELYKLLEAEFARHHMDEEVEDVLLDMAELLAEKNIIGQEASCHEKLGGVKIGITGICEADEEAPEEVSVYVKTLTIAGKTFEIEDYVL